MFNYQIRKTNSQEKLRKRVKTYGSVENSTNIQLLLSLPIFQELKALKKRFPL